jgi:hypothetical protein
LRVLRHAIHAGKIPAPPSSAATAALPAEWLDRAKAAIEATPATHSRVFAPKVPAFARYEGTSAWRKYRHRVRAYNAWRAAD